MENTWSYIEKGFSLVNYEVIDHKILRDPIFINRLVILESMSSSNFENFQTTMAESVNIDSLITHKLNQ